MLPSATQEITAQSGSVYSVYTCEFKFVNQEHNGSFQNSVLLCSLCVRENTETFSGSRGAGMDMACLQVVLLVGTGKWKKVWATSISKL